MARKPAVDKEIERVPEKPEGLLWLQKASEHEILERLHQDCAILMIHPALDGIVSYRIEENPAHTEKVVHVWR